MIVKRGSVTLRMEALFDPSNSIPFKNRTLARIVEKITNPNMGTHAEGLKLKEMSFERMPMKDMNPAVHKRM